MKTKVIFTFVLILALHLLALLPSCDLFMECGDPYIIKAPVDRAVIYAYSVNTIQNTGIYKEYPLDKNSLRLYLALSASDSIDLYAQISGSLFINSAFAFQCADPILRLTEHIENIEIWQLSDTLKEITDQFLVENFDNDLFQNVDSYLKKTDIYQINLAYRDSLLIGNVTLIVKTHLSDQRILTDTLDLELK